MGTHVPKEWAMRLSSSIAIRAALSASESTLRRSKMPSPPPNGDTGARGPCTRVVNDLAFVRSVVKGASIKYVRKNLGF